jgi:hypothetical protein
MAAVALAVVATPLDAALAPAERRLYRRAGGPRRPVVFVTGAPRSGTTLVSQVLLQNLPVTFFNNLTMVFPRSPLTANLVLGRWLRPRPSYRSFYGRTAGFAGPNDGLHLWDRWMGEDRYAVPASLPAATRRAVGEFFGAWERAFDRPVLNKNNALATCISLVAQTLETAHFVYVRREPAFNVQSIIGARERIQGSRALPYGVGDPRRAAGPRGDYVEEVCAQVLHHERRLREQLDEVGPRRIWVVDYEEFCGAPHRLVERVADEVLRVPLDRERVRRALPRFHDTNRIVLPRAEFDAIERTLARLGGQAEPRVGAMATATS